MIPLAQLDRGRDADRHERGPAHGEARAEQHDEPEHHRRPEGVATVAREEVGERPRESPRGEAECDRRGEEGEGPPRSSLFHGLNGTVGRPDLQYLGIDRSISHP